jgi:glycosyltransferase involved in cell wall biosynthesis
VTLALSVVMPAHNETELLGSSVHEVVAGLRSRSLQFEVLVVENGSTDATLEIAKKLDESIAEVVAYSLPDADYGRALRTGLAAARAEYVVNFDVDYYDLAFLDDAVSRVGRAPAPAIVVGSKRAPGARDTRPWSRRVLTWGFSTLLRVGFGLRVSDTHGMKVMHRSRVQALAQRCRFDGDLFDSELVIRAEREGLGVVEIPVACEERRPSRTSVLRRALRTVGGLVRLRVTLWREGRSG